MLTLTGEAKGSQMCTSFSHLSLSFVVCKNWLEDISYFYKNNIFQSGEGCQFSTICSSNLSKVSILLGMVFLLDCLHQPGDLVT